MNKSFFYLIICITLLLFSPLMVSADPTDGLVSYWTFDDNMTNGSISIDSRGFQNGTITGAITGNPGILGQSYFFDGINDEVEIGAAVFDNAIGTFSCWINVSRSQASIGYIMTVDDRVMIYVGAICGVEGLLDPSFCLYDGGFKAAHNTTDINTSSWNMITGTWDGSNARLYINGSLFATESAGNPTYAVGRNDVIGIGSETGSSPFEGRIDECGIWNVTLSGSDISNLYDDYVNGIPYPFTPTPTGNNTINLSDDVSPDSGSLINSLPIFFNTTGNFTYSTTNCSLYINDTLNQTSVGVDNTTTNVLINFSLDGISDSNQTWFINCSDGSTSDQTITSWFIFDSQPPVITTNFVNNTLLFRNNLIGQWNFTDNILLHRLNVSVDGTEIFNLTPIGDDNYTFNLDYNITSLAVGNHTLFFEVADGHTATFLKDSDAYNPMNGLFNDYLKYEIRKPYKVIDIIIESKDKSLFDDWSTTEKFDRYSETYKPYKKSVNQTFIVTSTQKIYVINTPGIYKDSWLITGNHWRDFVLKNEPSSKVNIFLIDDYTAEIKITGIKNSPEELVFDSIGDLNIVNATYNFYIINMTSTFTNPVDGNLTTSYNLSVELGNITFNTSGITPAAILQWNTTNITATLTAFSNESVNFTATLALPSINADTNFTLKWHFNMSNKTNGFLTSLDQTQLLLNFTGNTINFTIIQLPQNTLLTQQVNLTLVGSTVTYNINNITTGNHVAIRLNDDTYQVIAESDGFVTSNFFVSVSNDSRVDKTIFMTNSTTVIQFTVIDGSLDTVSNATLKFLQNVNGTFVLFSQGTTDFSGIAQVGLDETITYSFNVTHPDFELFTGIITPVLSEYTIKLDEIGIVFYESIEEQVLISTPFYYVPNSSVAAANFTVVSLVTPNVVEWYSMNTTYNSTFFGGNNSLGTISFDIPINLSIQNVINITYNVKITDHDVYSWTETYFLPSITGNFTSVTGGLFDVPGLGVAGRVILAMFLTVIMMVAVGTATKSLTVGALVGMFVLGGTVAGGLIPFIPGSRFNPGAAAITTLIVLGFLIISDQLVGRVST